MTFKPYRFSPIKTRVDMQKAIEHIHLESFKLCKYAFDKYLPVAGNIGIFCHYPDEYDYLLAIRKELTEESNNFNQKYFKLYESITIAAKGDVPAAVYDYLYIRKPDPYRSHVGDLDFVLDAEIYKKLKQEMLEGKKVPCARVFARPDLDMIELYDPDVDVLAYISTATMAQAVRVKLSEHTNL
jgi:hypothetical protein